MNSNKELYEKYHSKIIPQKKYPSENNFTHYYSFALLKKYSINIRKALELGCGAGTNLFFLAKKGIDITGVDISKNAIQNCIESSKCLKVNKFSFINEDILKYKSKFKYELIICFEVLEHLPNEVDCINMIYRMLKDNGIALISVPSKNSLFYKLKLLTKSEKEIGHLRRYNKNEIVGILTKTKFKIIEIQFVEGPIRDILFHIKPFEFFIKFLRGPLSKIINAIDLFFSKIFGESRIIIVLQK